MFSTSIMQNALHNSKESTDKWTDSYEAGMTVLHSKQFSGLPKGPSLLTEAIFSIGSIDNVTHSFPPSVVFALCSVLSS